MFKTIKAIVSSIILTILIFSCGKETQSSTQGGGLFKLRYTITPALQNGKNPTGDGNSFLSFCNSSPSLAGLTLSWIGFTSNNPCSTLETNEFAVTKGQNVTIQSITIGNSYDDQCRTLKIEAFINGKVFNTVVKEMGYYRTNTLIKCKDVDQNSVNYIIP